VKAQARALPPLLALTLLLTSALAAGADIGHARLLSAVGEPLRLVVPVTGLTATEAATLSARAADAAAWQQQGLTPPVALATLRVEITAGSRADARNLVISAAQPPKGEVVDLLLEIASATGQRRVQVSVIMAQPIGTVTLARLAAVSTVLVQRGDVLWRIARQHQYADVTIYQMLAALYQANLPAFIRANMNWLRAGVTLAIPDAATVRAIDPLAARRLFLTHQEAFFRHRGARAGAVTVSTVTQTITVPAASAAALAEQITSADATGDRVRLAGITASVQADQIDDEAVARQRAQHDAALRIAQLERNISDLNQALLVDAQASATRAESAESVTTTATAMPPPAASVNRHPSVATTVAAVTEAIEPEMIKPLTNESQTVEPTPPEARLQPAGVTALATPAADPSTDQPSTQAHTQANTQRLRGDWRSTWVWAVALGVAVLLALLALVRRRRRARLAHETTHAAVLREQFAQQLKAIDLNLDDAASHNTVAPPR